jgi:hypothetical protein
MVVGAARAAGVGRLMNYDGFFTDAIGRVRRELRYRVFADLERIAGRFPPPRSGIHRKARVRS